MRKPASLLAAAAHNNADWCASICRSHSIPYSFGDTVWHSAGRTPLYYPDAVTLRPDAAPSDFLPEIDTSPGCSIKDSFAVHDLTSHGFTELFTAQWIHRPAGLRAPAPPALRAVRVATAAELRAWQIAWHGGDKPPDVFRPPLLVDPSVLVLSLHQDEDLAGGVVLSRGSGLVGLSNLFAVGGGDGAAVWSSAITAAAVHFPGLSIVGYDCEDGLAHALGSGFVELGPLRVWLRES
nr:hypothetical protein [Kibdelosporangium sp. MJ126-NF4]